MENQGFYDLPNGSTPAAGRQNKGLYDFSDEVQTQSKAPRYTGNTDVDEWIHSLPEDQRADAIKKVNEPLTGEEISTHIDRNPSYRFTNEKDFLAYTNFRKNEERSTIADLADGVANMTDLIGTAVSQMGEKPGNAALTAVPSIIEGSIQATRDTLGLVAQSTNPNSAVFRFRHALFGTGTVADQMRQVNDALQFNERSNRLINGEDTIVLDKDFINPGVTQVAALLADPVTLIPFGKAAKLVGIGNIAMKGARAAGFGAGMIDLSIKAQKIKTAVLSGALQWGVGMPLDAVGGAVRGTIDYSIDKFGKVVEFSTGVDAADVSRATRLAGAGSATAGLAGVSIPYATSAATAYYAGSFAKGMGEAVGLVSEQMRKQGGHRGLFSYATMALDETEALLAQSGGTMNPATRKMLKLIDKIDPLMSYASEATTGAMFGGAIGGVLGALNEGEKGFGFGLGMGAVGGALGAGTGRAFADISGATFRERLMVSSEFARRLYHEKDPVSAIMLDRLIGDSRMNGETRRALDLFSLALGKVDGLISFRALSSEEYPHYLDTLNKAGLYDAANDPTPSMFKQADGFQIRRTATGATEIVINTDKFFSKNQFGRHVVAHEFLHGFIMSSSLGENFKKMFRDTVLGFKDRNGKVLSKGIVPPDEFKEFVLNYFGQGSKNLSDAEGKGRAATMKEYAKVLDKWEAQGRAGVEPLNLGEMNLLERMTEEFAAYYFSAWFDGADAYFIASGGRLTGVRSIMDTLKTAWLDNIENRVNLHDTAFTFTRQRGKDLTGGFYRDGKRIRVGAMDHLIRDIYRLSSSLAAKGYIDLSGMTDSGRKTFFERAGLDDVASKNKKGKWVPKSDVQSAADAKRLGASAEIVLEGLDASVRTSTKHADGVIRGPFSEIELNALVDAGLISQGLASKFKLLHAMANDQSGFVPNVAEFGYIGKERGLSETNDNLRSTGADVPYTNRKVLVIDAIGEISADGKFSWRIKALDLKVIERRMANKWSDAAVRDLFDNNLSLMEYEFYNVYLRNASLPIGHAERIPSANLWPANGDAKRNVLHDIAGFAKAEDLSYVNLPLAQVPRGILSSVSDFSIGRMHVVRPAQVGRLPYVHKNAFYDIAANFKLSNSVEEQTPAGRIYYTPNGYSYHERDGAFSVIDPLGIVVAKAATASEAESLALSNFETRAKSINQQRAETLFTHLNAAKYRFSNMEEVSAGVAELVKNMPKEAVVDLPLDVMGFHLDAAFNERGAAGVNEYIKKVLKIDEYRIDEKGNLLFKLPDVSKYSADGILSEEKLYSVTRISMSGEMKTALYMEMIKRASDAGGVNGAALVIYHSSLRHGIYRDGFFDESHFKQYADGSIEPVAWGAPAIKRTNKAETRKGEGDEMINLSRFSGTDEGPQNSAIPLSIGIGKGKVAIHQHNVMMWVHDWLLNNPEGVAFAEANKLTKDEIKAFGKAYVEVGCVGSRLKINKPIQAIHDRIYNAVRGDKNGLIDKINRLNTTPIVEQYQKQGYGLLVMPHIGTSYFQDSIVTVVLSSNKYETAKDLPKTPTPLTNFAIAGSNVIKNAQGEWVRNPTSLIKMYEDVIGFANGKLGRTLSEYDFRQGGKYRYTNESQFAGSDMVAASNVTFEAVMNAITHEAGRTASSNPDKLWLTRVEIVNNNAATFLKIEHAARVLEEIKQIKEAVAAENPMLTEEQYTSQLGDISAQSLKEAAFLDRQKILFAEMKNILSKLDDDFIGLMESGYQFIHSNGPGGDGLVALATARLDWSLNGSTDTTSTLARADLEPYLATINAEVLDQTNGFVELKYVERQELDYATIGSTNAHNAVSLRLTNSELKSRPTFVWSQQAKERFSAFVNALNLSEEQLAGFTTWPELLESNPELVRRVQDTTSPEHRVNVEFAEFLSTMRSRSSQWYRSYSTKSIEAQNAAEVTRGLIRDYATFVTNHTTDVISKQATRVMEYVKNFDKEMYIVVDKEGIADRLAEMKAHTEGSASSGTLEFLLNEQLNFYNYNKNFSDLLQRMKDAGVSQDAQNYLKLLWMKSMSDDSLYGFNPEKVYEAAVMQEALPYAQALKAESLAISKNLKMLDEIRAATAIWIGKQGEFKDIGLAGAFRSGLQDGIAEAVSKFPTGITAQNLLKELERINSSGVPVLEEARVTGFLDFLKEKAALPKDSATGKFKKLDLEEVKAYLDANKLELVLGKDVKFDINSGSLLNTYVVRPTGGKSEKDGGGNIIVRSTNPRYYPATGRSGHVEGTPARGQDTYGWVRYTSRKTSDGRRFLYVEEAQAQNNGSLKQALDLEQSVASQFEKELLSPGGIAALDKFRETFNAGVPLVSEVLPYKTLRRFMAENFGYHMSMSHRDFLSQTLNHLDSSYVDTPENVARMNIILKPALLLVNKTAAAVSELSGLMLQSASGSAVQDFFGGTYLKETKMDRAHLLKIRDLVDKHAKTERVKVTSETSEQALSAFLTEEIRTVQQYAEDGSTYAYETLEKSSPRTYRFMDFLINKAFMPGTAEGIMKLYLEEAAKRIRKEDNSAWDWSGDFEEMLQGSALKAKIDEYVAGRVVEKSYRDTASDGTPLVVRFSSKRGVIAAYRDLLGKLSKDTAQGVPTETAFGHFFPEMAREAVKIQHAHRRDKALLRITGDALSSGNIRKFLQADLSNNYFSNDWPTMSAADGGTWAIAARLMKGTNGSSSQSPYTKMFDSLEAVLAASNRRGRNFNTEGFLDTTTELTLSQTTEANNFASPPVFWSAPSNGAGGQARIRTKYIGGPDGTFRPSYIYHTHMWEQMTRANPDLGRLYDDMGGGTLAGITIRPDTGPLGPKRPKLMLKRNEDFAYSHFSVPEGQTNGPEFYVNTRGIFEEIMESGSNRNAFLANVEQEVANSGDSKQSSKQAEEGLELLKQLAPLTLPKFVDAFNTVFYRDRPFQGFEINASLDSYSGEMKIVLEDFIKKAKEGKTSAELAKLLKNGIIPKGNEERFKALDVVPFLTSKEYFTLLGKATLMFALREGYDGIGVLAPADGASGSNLTYNKGLDIYGNFIATYWSKVFKREGFDLKPSMPLTYKTCLAPEVEQVLKSTIQSLHQDRLKTLGKLVTLKSDSEHGNTYKLKPEHLVAIARFIKVRQELAGSNRSPFKDENGSLTSVENLSSTFLETQDSLEKAHSAVNADDLDRGGDGKSKISLVNKDPAGDIFAAYLIHRIGDAEKPYTAAGEKDVTRQRDKARDYAIEQMVSPFFAMMLNNDFNTPINSGGNVFEFSDFHQDMTYSGIVAKLAAVTQAVKELSDLGSVLPEQIEKLNEILNYMEITISEIQAHYEMSQFFKVDSFEKQKVISGKAALETSGVNAETHAALGISSNRTDIYLRGSFLDLTKTPEEIKQKANERGVYMLKPSADEEPGGSMVGPGTKPFKGGFISTMASTFSNLTNKVRIYVGEEGEGDGSSLSVKLYPRGTEDLSQESRHVEVKAVTTPSTRRATMLTVNGDDEGKYVRLAKAELNTRLRSLGYDIVTDDGWSPKNLPYEESLRSRKFERANLESEFSKNTKQGIQAADRLEKAGGKLFFGKISEKTTSQMVDGDPLVGLVGTYRIAIKNKDESIGMHVDVEVDQSYSDKVVAKVVGSNYEKFKFAYEDEVPEKALQYTIPEERAEYSRNYPKNPKEIKELMLAELTNRLGDMGVDDVQGLDGFMQQQPSPVSEGVTQSQEISMGQYSEGPTQRQQTQPMARIQSPSKPAFKPSQGPVIQARSWIPGREGNVYTITSTDGYFIAFKNKKFRLYSPAKAMIGMYENEEEAKRKAEAHAKNTKR